MNREMRETLLNANMEGDQSQCIKDNLIKVGASRTILYHYSVAEATQNQL